jgi:undecaprenyl-diphosphatase
VGDLLNFNDEKGKLFELVIQMGAIFAVCWEYRKRIHGTFSGLRKREKIAQQFTINLVIAFLPAAVLGFLFSKYIKAILFKPVPVALAFIIGALIIFWAEKREHTVRINSVDELSKWDALKLGLAQSAALIPGTSRSGATIIGGLLFGLSRQAATEFSFFLAIPTLTAASLYDLYKHRELLDLAADAPHFILGMVAAFFSALLAIKALLRYISEHDFLVFAWYRLFFGAIVLITAYSGVVKWTID